MLTVLIVALYFALTVALGIFSRHRVRSAGKFEGQSLPLFVCVAISAGEWLGGTATTGVSEWGYLFGISGAWYTVANALGICFLAVFFARLYRRLNTTTIPEIIGRNLGHTARVASSAFLTFVLLIVGVSQMLAVGSLGETLLGLSPALSIVLLGGGVALYTVLGGMDAVGRTNLLHVAVMYAGIIVALIFCANNSGFSETLPVSYFSPLGIGKKKIFSWIVSSLLGACTAQAGLQPILRARDEDTAVKSSFLTALIVAPFGIMAALLGMSAKSLFPSLSNAKSALPKLILTMPPFLSGVVLASILAAILSTAAPIFLSCGTLITRDIVSGFLAKNGNADTKILAFSRAATLSSAVVCISLALFLESAAILDIVYFAYSLRASLFIILLLALFWRKMTGNAALIALVATAVVSLLWIFFQGKNGSYPIPFLNENWAALITALIASVFASLITKKNKGVL